MEAQWQADRAALRDLLRTRPDLSLKEIARHLHRSYSWVKDWAKRLATALPDDLDILRSRSRARHTPYQEWDTLVLRRLEQLRLFPPDGLQRTPGPPQPARVMVERKPPRATMLSQKGDDRFQRRMCAKIILDLGREQHGGSGIHKVEHLDHVLSFAFSTGISRHARIFEIHLDFFQRLAQWFLSGDKNGLLGQESQTFEQFPDGFGRVWEPTPLLLEIHIPGQVVKEGCVRTESIEVHQEPAKAEVL